MKIAIIGNGNVGSALERGLKRAGHDVRATGHENVRETAEWGESIILAVPFGAIDDAVQTMADAVNGKGSSTSRMPSTATWHWSSDVRPAERRSCSGKLHGRRW